MLDDSVIYGPWMWMKVYFEYFPWKRSILGFACWIVIKMDETRRKIREGYFELNCKFMPILWVKDHLLGCSRFVLLTILAQLLSKLARWDKFYLDAKNPMSELICSICLQTFFLCGPKARALKSPPSSSSDRIILSKPQIWAHCCRRNSSFRLISILCSSYFYAPHQLITRSKLTLTIWQLNIFKLSG